MDGVTGEELGHSLVASRFDVVGGVVASYRRHDQLGTALTAAGPNERDEVLARQGD